MVIKLTSANCAVDIPLFNQISKEYRNYLDELPLSPTSKRKYGNTGLYFLRVLGIQCTREELHTFLREKNYTPNSYNVYHAHLTIFYKWLKKAGYRTGPNPMKKIPKMKEPRALPRPVSDRELARALGYAPKRIRLMLLLGAYAGLRGIEIANLRVRDIDTEKMMIYVRDGKGGKNRLVPLHPDILDAFYQYYGAENDEQGMVFFPTLGHPRALYAQWASRELHNFYVEHGLQMTTHQLRHWFATHVLKVNKDIVSVSKLLGHSELATTMVYAQWDMDSGIAGVNGLVASFDKNVFKEYGKAITPLTFKKYPKVGERSAYLGTRDERGEKILDKFQQLPDLQHPSYRRPRTVRSRDGDSKGNVIPMNVEKMLGRRIGQKDDDDDYEDDEVE